MTPPPPAPMPSPEQETPNMEMDSETPPMDEPMPDSESLESPMGNEENMEGDDKKKEIQKLAGELSELLHTYNEENGEDEELNKYVKGMINAQTDGDENNDEANFDGENKESEELDMSDTEKENEDMEMPEPPKMEGRRITKKQLKEEFAQIGDNQKKDDENRVNKKIVNKRQNAQSPFMPPKFN